MISLELSRRSRRLVERRPSKLGVIPCRRLLSSLNAVACTFLGAHGFRAPARWSTVEAVPRYAPSTWGSALPRWPSG